MAKQIELKAKQSFEDKETGKIYKKGQTYSFTEKRAEELLKNSYLVEKVSETVIKETEETATSTTKK